MRAFEIQIFAEAAVPNTATESGTVQTAVTPPTEPAIPTPPVPPASTTSASAATLPVEPTPQTPAVEPKPEPEEKKYSKADVTKMIEKRLFQERKKYAETKAETPPPVAKPDDDFLIQLAKQTEQLMGELETLKVKQAEAELKVTQLESEKLVAQEFDGYPKEQVENLKLLVKGNTVEERKASIAALKQVFPKPKSFSIGGPSNVGGADTSPVNDPPQVAVEWGKQRSESLKKLEAYLNDGR